MKISSLIGIAAVTSIVTAAITTLVVTSFRTPSEQKLISDFYAIENAVHVSPHSIRKSIMKGEEYLFTLVDLRSQEEYEKEHIVGAVNIPAYKDKDTSDYGSVDRIVKAFSELPKEKDIIVYCYSMPCMTGRKIGKMLAEHGIFVKHLGIGWNEWRHYWNLWNHEHEWNATKVSDYISTGKDPGIFKGKKTGTGACPIDNQFGC